VQIAYPGLMCMPIIEHPSFARSQAKSAAPPFALCRSSLLCRPVGAGQHAFALSHSRTYAHTHAFIYSGQRLLENMLPQHVASSLVRREASALAERWQRQQQQQQQRSTGSVRLTSALGASSPSAEAREPAAGGQAGRTRHSLRNLIGGGSPSSHGPLRATLRVRSAPLALPLAPSVGGAHQDTTTVLAPQSQGFVGFTVATGDSDCDARQGEDEARQAADATLTASVGVPSYAQATDSSLAVPASMTMASGALSSCYEPMAGWQEERDSRDACNCPSPALLADEVADPDGWDGCEYTPTIAYKQWHPAVSVLFAVRGLIGTRAGLLPLPVVVSHAMAVSMPAVC
jgi:hypothetical protein